MITNILLFIKKGVSLVKEEKECNHSPLSLSLVLGHEWVVMELLLCLLLSQKEKGKDVLDIRKGRSPLYIAAELGMSYVLVIIIVIIIIVVNMLFLLW